MGRIVVSENVSLDGVAQDPTGDEGFRHGGWLDRGREEWVKVELDEALRAKLVQKPCKWALCVARAGATLTPSFAREGVVAQSADWQAATS